MRASLYLLGLAIALPATAHAQEREYCPSRPGLGTTPCIISPGKVSVETAIADWTRDDQSDSRTDTILIGDTVVRLGLTDTVEASVGFRPFGHVRERDKASGSIDTRNRVGDVELGVKTSLANPDGDGLSVAVMPFVALPVGRVPTGAGDWATGLLVPVTYDLSETFNLQFTPEIDAAVDEDHHGRHLAYSGVIGLGMKLAKAVDLTAEFEALRDDDPADHATQTFAALSLTWKTDDDTQLDMGGTAGLNADTPDTRIYAGISRRF